MHDEAIDFDARKRKIDEVRAVRADAAPYLLTAELINQSFITGLELIHLSGVDVTSSVSEGDNIRKFLALAEMMGSDDGDPRMTIGRDLFLNLGRLCAVI